METENIATLSEAAAELATTEMKVLMLLKRKELEGELVEGEWRISRQSLAHFRTHGPISAESTTSCASACRGCGQH
ncbi:hypothetical protein [Geobacter sp. SVR]|uniref:hypothetical protein n=1 Tax=Geobacter sp. SVR TaxID=2495594 RepID=UPI00143EFD2B|nr:hypothetical protein [Geobacter sp. SVR]BCS53109.1 hypothetical protein GSVR_14170 [Geobacter sp. SVR]GCF84494.1 hypothetical protein GSbR_10940 [Geobacter sp. SVR]